MSKKYQLLYNMSNYNSWTDSISDKISVADLLLIEKYASTTSVQEVLSNFRRIFPSVEFDKTSLTHSTIVDNTVK